MTDPLARKPVTTLRFAQLHIPKMKSIYWEYFGYPTNENRKIITKQNVVCTICRRVLTNHGNTTNLRAHLQHRHKDIFSQMMQENNMKVPQRKAKMPAINELQPKVKRESKLQASEGRIKIEYLEMSGEEEALSAAEEEHNTMLYESIVPMTYDDDENIDSESFAKVEIRPEISGGDSTGNLSQDIKTLVSNEGEEDLLNDDNMLEQGQQSGQTVDYHRMQIVAENSFNEFQMQDALLNVIVSDLHSLDSLYDPGMGQLLRLLLPENIEILSKSKIELTIREIYSDKLAEVLPQIKEHSQTKPFSLSFEMWRNIEQKHFLTVYYNCTNDSVVDATIVNQLFTTFEYNKYTNIEAVFEDFNLENCTAAVVNYNEDDYLIEFLRSKNISVIVSFDVIIDKCLRETLSLPSVASIVEEVNDVIMRFQCEMTSKGIDIPIYNDEFPWTCFEVLKFFAETVSWPDELEPVVKSAKLLVDTYKTLNITLETLRGEEVPFSSLISPFVARILNNQYVVSEKDHEIVKEVKTIIADLLKKFVLEDDNLTVSALLDPRFHRLINVRNYNRCLQILKEKWDKINSDSGSTQKNNTSASMKSLQSLSASGSRPSASNSSKKSNLELFFDISDKPDSSSENVTCSVENDLQRYRKDVHVALDQSPIVWWQQMGQIYRSLKQIASHYLCVPCVVNMQYKKSFEEQIRFHQKRFMLTGNMLDAILFLNNYNNNHVSGVK